MPLQIHSDGHVVDMCGLVFVIIVSFHVRNYVFHLNYVNLQHVSMRLSADKTCVSLKDKMKCVFLSEK